MSAPRATWIGMPKAQDIIRRETQLPNRETEPAFLKALADGEIQSQHTIMYWTDIPGGVEPGPTIQTPAGFWTQADFMRHYQDQQTLSCVPLYAPNDHEGWYFDVHYDELLGWLSRESRYIAKRGRPFKWDWEGVLIEAVLEYTSLADLPDTQAGVESYMASWFEEKTGGSPSEGHIREKASKLYKALKARKLYEEQKAKK